MRILCFSIDLPGHLDWGGYLATATELKRRGHTLLWASGAGVEQQVATAGVEFKALPHTGWQHSIPPLSPDLSPQQRQQARQTRALQVWLDPENVLAALQSLLALADAFQPDVILSEPFAAAAALLAETQSIPLIMVGRPALPIVNSEGPASDAIRKLCGMAGVEGNYWDISRGMPRSPDLHLDFFCRPWYSDLPVIARQTVFCGGLAARHAPPSQTQKPLVLVTLGSTYANDETFFRLACEGTHMAGGQALAVTGKRAPGLLASLREAPPGRTKIEEWVAYGQVFPDLAAVVHHGGVGTTHAALVHALPQVVIPHAGDQFPQAARVTQAEVGYGIRPKDFTHESAALIISDLLSLSEFKENARALAEDMQVLGGIRTAADAVERL